MNNINSQREPPSGLRRLFFRLPIWLYRLHLGRLLGERMLLLSHVGRKSGKVRQAVLEVVEHDAGTDTFYVASGFGARSDWYQNVLHTPDVVIQVGGRTLPVTAVPLTPEQSGDMLVDYARRHPTAAKTLSQRVMGIDVDGSDARYREIGRKYVPFVAFRPREAT